jgi:hypothetical protein
MWSSDRGSHVDVMLKLAIVYRLYPPPHTESKTEPMAESSASILLMSSRSFVLAWTVGCYVGSEGTVGA